MVLRTSASSVLVATTLVAWSTLQACASNSPSPATPAPPDAAATPPADSASPPAAANASASPASSSAPAPGGSTSEGADRTHADVHALLLKHRDAFRACYDNARKKDASLQGTFVIDFVLKPNGAVKEATHNKTKSEIKDDAMGSCALATLRGISFPPSQKGLETTISYPFGFKPNASK